MEQLSSTILSMVSGIDFTFGRGYHLITIGYQKLKKCLNIFLGIENTLLYCKLKLTLKYFYLINPFIIPHLKNKNSPY